MGLLDFVAISYIHYVNDEFTFLPHFLLTGDTIVHVTSNVVSSSALLWVIHPKIVHKRSKEAIETYEKQLIPDLFFFF